MSAPTRQYSTGLEFLDRRIGGGIEVGGLLALTAPAASQSELLLAQFLANHRTVFVSTTRPAREVEDWVAGKAGEDADATIEHAEPEDLLEDPDRLTRSLTPESVLVVDTINELETAPRERYLPVLDHLKRRLRETDSIGIVHGTHQESTPPRRGLTLNRADHVWQLEILVTSREIKTRLLIPKARRGQALTEPIPLLLTDRVRIDTSRRIA